MSKRPVDLLLDDVCEAMTELSNISAVCHLMSFQMTARQ